MTTIGQTERHTQNRVVALFCSELGYRHLGDWSDRKGNSNIDEGMLTAYLAKNGYNKQQIDKAQHRLRSEADNANRGLYGNNKEVYSLLYYGVSVKTEAGELSETVKLINWQQPEQNDFAIAEEVTLRGGLERRPDLVLYVNGIAIAVIELKNSRVSIGEAIRQNRSNQEPEFNAAFFSTVQFVFAGNDSEGLQYGAIGTPEKYFLKWKEDEADNSRFKLDKYLLKMCNRARLLELIHDFVLFDGGIKKLPRVHQYFGVKAAQERVNRHEGGIIWHTQGSGKSIVMVLLAKWILENKPHARVVIVTDRDELDKQIEGVFNEANIPIVRTISGQNLMTQLAKPTPRLLCSLIHKFGKRGVDDFEQFIRDLEAQPSQAVGDIFVFIDECHRTQSGKLHRTMKALMPNAVLIGFTGTPLLKQDKATSIAIFGGKRYIHKYLFNEAVQDKVILDLMYESFNIDQHLGDEEKVDEWFDATTSGLNDWQKAALREQWGTMQNVLSSASRMTRIVRQIVFDFKTKPRLSDSRGNAMLVVSSIYEACKYFELFGKTPFKGKCAVVTSYNPQTKDITLEETGANSDTDKQFIYHTYMKLLKKVEAAPGKSKTETYEDDVKDKFKKEPANMKLLVVVDKLLTGFDAPSCTYLYIDKSMQDHGLFQAICRVNRLDGDDKSFGYIVDFKNLLHKVDDALRVYTAELDDADGEEPDPTIVMKDRLKIGKLRLDDAIEALALLCEPVQPPKGELEHIHYFCGNSENTDDLRAHEPQRVTLYKGVAALVRAYANIADDLQAAGYSAAQIVEIKARNERYVRLRQTIRRSAGETIDLKAYEADMRHLIDTYIEADDPRKISKFDDIPLLDLILRDGIGGAVDTLPEGIKGNRAAVAETIENNVRRKIIKDHLNDPAFYDKMSALLDEIIAALRAKAVDYAEYLKRIEELAKKVQTGRDADTPAQLRTPGLRALYNWLKAEFAPQPAAGVAEEDVPYVASAVEPEVELALRLDAAVKAAKPDDWRGTLTKERTILRAIFDVLGNAEQAQRLFQIIKQQREY